MLPVLKLNRQQIELLLSEESLLLRLGNGGPVQVQLAEVGVAVPVDVPEKQVEVFTLQEKINIFASLFVGRSDAYAVRWESKAGKTGYSPVCENQWRPGICQLPKIKCNDCLSRKYVPLTDQVLEQHLRGEKIVGLYPLLPDSSCHFLAFDCDGKNWSADSRALMETIQEWNLPAYRER